MDLEDDIILDSSPVVAPTLDDETASLAEPSKSIGNSDESPDLDPPVDLKDIVGSPEQVHSHLKHAIQLNQKKLCSVLTTDMTAASAILNLEALKRFNDLRFDFDQKQTTPYSALDGTISLLSDPVMADDTAVLEKAEQLSEILAAIDGNKTTRTALLKWAHKRLMEQYAFQIRDLVHKTTGFHFSTNKAEVDRLQFIDIDEMKEWIFLDGNEERAKDGDAAGAR
ncbi:hypothetical protein C8J56DRAFT_1051732 [Mycena floridula]|nr:hypothetical protein C8J56DRAFT_1051732 [Mycena floridula]